MSNPGINRWGLNLFWYRFWYNDANNSLVVHQDSCIDKLVLCYLYFGLLYPQNMFISKYWYSSYRIKFSKVQSNFNSKYYRVIEQKNRFDEEEAGVSLEAHNLRARIKNVYFSKIWILRFQNWLVVNFYCFQPLKPTIKKVEKAGKASDFCLSKKIQNKSSLHRYKMYLFYFLNSFLAKDLYYKF